MKLGNFALVLTASLFSLVPCAFAQNWSAQAPPYGRPDATVDLRTADGAQVVKGEWRYSDVKIIEVESRGPGPDLKPSGFEMGSIRPHETGCPACRRQSLLQLVSHHRHGPRENSGPICGRLNHIIRDCYR